MARTSDNPKRFIVSCRVNDREMQVLQKHAQEEGVSISMLLRKSLDMRTSGDVALHA